MSKSRPAAALLMATAVATGVAGLSTGGASAEGVGQGCTTTTYTVGQWAYLDSGVNLYDTGVDIPAPGPGETLTITASEYKAFDLAPEGTIPSRADLDQQHESFTVSVGGVDIGGLTPDLPDTVAEGAFSDNHSGILVGSFAGGPTAGGRIVFRHAALYGFDESPNEVMIKYVSLTVECTSAPTTTEAPTTTVAPTTSIGSGGGATTTVSPAASVTTASATSVAAASGTLPATGSAAMPLAVIAAVLLGLGIVLLVRGRRTAP